MAERDWTSIVLSGMCDECGRDASAVDRAAVGPAVVEETERWREVLAADPTALRGHPMADRWSALEYACHSRDVITVMTGRLETGLVQDDPEWVWWDHDASVTDDAYNEQDPGAVADELVTAAERLAAVVDSFSATDWERTGVRAGKRLTLDNLTRFTLHEVAHHRFDAERLLAG